MLEEEIDICDKVKQNSFYFEKIKCKETLLASLKTNLFYNKI